MIRMIRIHLELISFNFETATIQIEHTLCSIQILQSKKNGLLFVKKRFLYEIMKTLQLGCHQIFDQWREKIE